MSRPEPHLDRIASAPRLLVACDFDGTLAPIVDDPDDAAALPASMAALKRLAAMEGLTVAIVSGRSRVELVDRFDDDFLLVGEHGADRGTTAPPEPESLKRAREMVADAHRSAPGSRVEQKPRSVVFHYRNVDRPAAIVDRLREQASALEGITVMEGKAVLELTTSPVDKGDAVEALRREQKAAAVLFIGDDITDESVFVRLGPGDLGVKVGSADTAAAARVEGPDEVTLLLEALADRRGD